MALKFAAWVHGNAAKAETPTLLAQNDGAGSHFVFNQQLIFPSAPPIPPLVVFRHSGTNSFHFTPTTPAIIDDVRLTLKRGFVLFNSTSALVTGVELFDGSKSVAMITNNGQQAGDAMDLANAFEFVLDPPLTIRFGLGIAVKVTFAFNTATQKDCRIWFGSVGADFEVP